MSARKHSHVLMVCFLILSCQLFSQILFQGAVTDNGGEYLGNGAEPVFNALVTLTDQNDANRSFSAVTDEQGRFSIEIITTGIGEDHTALPRGFRLYQNYPNPFNPSTVIRYELTQPCLVRIEVYNISGQKVKTLLDGIYNGQGQIIWDATDELGKGVPAGLYICSMKAAGIRINRKMLLIDGHYGPIHTKTSVSHGTIQSGKPVLRKSLSGLYLLEVTGENIAPFIQQDLEITEDMTIDVMVMRTVKDIDGNVYQTIKIGGQWWTADNLSVTHYRNGDAIPHVTDNTEWANLTTGAYCTYDNNESNADTYGCLYNWYAVKDNRNLAPEDWHVPVDWEWQFLVDFLEGDLNAGRKLKEAGTAHWDSLNNRATNESGFTALPGGYRLGHDGLFSGFNHLAYFWSVTEFSLEYAYDWNLYSGGSAIYRSFNQERYGFSVRLIRDNMAEVPLSSIQISPSDTVLCTGGTLQLTCTAIYSDSSAKDVTMETEWSISPGIAGQISLTGLFTAFDTSGVETITARYEDQEASRIIMIQDTTADSPGDITGTWQTVAETLDLSVYNMGKITLYPTHALFLNFVMIMKPDSTFEYETWTGPDRNAYDAEYEAGTGTWTAAGTTLFLDFEDYATDDLSGTFQFLDENRVQFSTVITASVLSPGEPMALPMVLVMERVTE
jgi:uncharacterized protein (TIGR02145 family)